MAFTRMAFSPSDGLKNKTIYPTTPTSEDEARAQIQGVFDQLRTALNDTMTALESVTSGSSGAENVGSATIPNVAGTTVREQIVDLKAQVDDVSTGSVSDGAITTVKLADNAVTKDKLGLYALSWELIANNDLDSASNTNLVIPAQTGKSEVMLVVTETLGSASLGMAIMPIDSYGMPLNHIICVTCSTQVGGFSNTTVNFTSATDVVCTPPSGGTGTALSMKKICIYSR
jgi:hypothetical protein